MYTYIYIYWPRIEKLIDKLDKAKFITMLDLAP